MTMKTTFGPFNKDGVIKLTYMCHYYFPDHIINKLVICTNAYAKDNYSKSKIREVKDHHILHFWPFIITWGGIVGSKGGLATPFGHCRDEQGHFLFFFYFVIFIVLIVEEQKILRRTIVRMRMTMRGMPMTMMRGGVNEQVGDTDD